VIKFFLLENFLKTDFFCRKTFLFEAEFSNIFV
jgi:hypothetical protein